MKYDDLYDEHTKKMFDMIINSEFFKNNYDKDNEEQKFKFLFHGSDSIELKGNAIVMLNSKERTSSQDTFPFVHQYLNKISEEKFGVKIRNLLFAYNSSVSTFQYGDTLCVFPIGDYQLFYSTSVVDFTISYGADRNGTGSMYPIKDFYVELAFNFFVKYLMSLHINRDSSKSIVYKLIQRVFDNSEILTIDLNEINEYLYNRLKEAIIFYLKDILLQEITDEQLEKINSFLNNNFKIKCDEVFKIIMEKIKEYITGSETNHGVIESKKVPSEHTEIMVKYDKAIFFNQTMRHKLVDYFNHYYRDKK